MAKKNLCLLCERAFCVVLRLCQFFHLLTALPLTLKPQLLPHPSFSLNHQLFWLLLQFPISYSNYLIAQITIHVPCHSLLCSVQSNVISATFGTLLGGYYHLASEPLNPPPHPCGIATQNHPLITVPFTDISMIISHPPNYPFNVWPEYYFTLFPSSFHVFFPFLFFPSFFSLLSSFLSILPSPFLSKVSNFCTHVRGGVLGSVHLLLQKHNMWSTLHSNVPAELELLLLVFSFLLKQHFPLWLSVSSLSLSTKRSCKWRGVEARWTIVISFQRNQKNTRRKGRKSTKNSNRIINVGGGWPKKPKKTLNRKLKRGIGLEHKKSLNTNIPHITWEGMTRLDIQARDLQGDGSIACLSLPFPSGYTLSFSLLLCLLVHFSYFFHPFFFLFSLDDDFSNPPSQIISSFLLFHCCNEKKICSNFTLSC